MNRWTDTLTSPTFRRAAIVLYVMCLGGLLAAFFSVSLLQVQNSAYIQASPTIEKGRPNAMRGIVLDAPTGQFVTGADIKVELVEGVYEGDDSLEALAQARRVSVADGHTERSGHMHLTAKAPEGWEAGDYALVVEANGRAIEDFRAGASVAIADRSVARDYWPERTDRLPKDDRRRLDAVTESKGPVEIDLLPRDGRVSRGLKTEVFLRTTDRETGEPVSAEVHLEVEGLGTKGLPKSVETDELGLARIEVTAMTDQTWTVKSPAAEKPEVDEGEPDSPDEPEKPESQAKIQITTVPTQVALEMNDVLAVPGEPSDGVVNSLFNSGGLMVDLYNADDWIEATAFGIRPDESGVRVNVPSLQERSPLYRVQVYKSFYSQGGAWDVEYLVAAEGRELGDYQQAAQMLAEHLRAHTDDPYFAKLAESDVFSNTTNETRLRGWIEAMLEAVPRHFDRPPILINSQKAARDKLEAWKDDAKDHLMLLTGFALLIGLAVVGYLVVLGVRSYQQQNRMLRDVEFEMSLEDEANNETSNEHASTLDRSIAEGNIVAGLQIFIVVATLVFFVLGILLLLSYL